MIFLVVGSALFVYMSLWFIVALKQQRSDRADIAWGPGFALVAWLSLFLQEVSTIGIIVNCLITVWAARLSAHIYYRNRVRGDDFRYTQWENRSPVIIYFQVFLLQGACIFLFSAPIFVIHAFPETSIGWIHWIGLTLWTIGFLTEGIADYELLQFKSDPLNNGKLFTKGVWKLCRHPNFFGEFLQWWAIWLFAATLPWGWITVLSPILFTLIVVLITGVKPIEQRMSTNAEFQKYAKSTPKLLPLYFSHAVSFVLYWFFALLFTTNGQLVIATLLWAVCFGFHIYLLYRFKKEIYRFFLFFAGASLILGIIQQVLLMATGAIEYINAEHFPPFWVYSLFPLIASLLYSCFPFVLGWPLRGFFFGGALGTLGTYLTTELSIALIPSYYGYILLFTLWGAYFSALSQLSEYLRRQ